MNPKRESEQADHLEDAVEGFLDAKQKGNDSGNYRALAANVLGRWSEWLHDCRINDLNQVDAQHMRRYAQRLRQRPGAGIAARRAALGAGLPACHRLRVRQATAEAALAALGLR